VRTTLSQNLGLENLATVRPECEKQAIVIGLLL